jgi:hypothetical protein
MKTRKALLAERLATEQVIQSIESRAQSGALTNGPNGTLSVSMPIKPGELKQLAQLRGKLAASDALLGTQKSQAGRMVDAVVTSPAATPELLTEQMLALRWHCSTSRLQRWRANQKGPTYLKIGGKVLYRLEDLRQYEKAHIVQAKADV